MKQLLTALCRASQGILQQKLGLMQALCQKHGLTTAQELYRTTCPIVHATIGQHFRHSLDHMEAATFLDHAEIHYDLRTRGGVDETEWEAATARIQQVSQLLDIQPRAACGCRIATPRPSLFHVVGRQSR